LVIERPRKPLVFQSLYSAEHSTPAEAVGAEGPTVVATVAADPNLYTPNLRR